MTCDINIIQNANNNNKLTIFIGSGISKSSNLPSWDDLISKIKKDLSLDEKENDYLKIAQLFYLSCGEVVYYQEIKKYFPDNIEPTIIQKMIFDLKEYSPADKDRILLLSGNGEVIEPDGSVAAIGSGGFYALAAGRALAGHSQLTAAEIAKEALTIAADICVYTNHNIKVEELEEEGGASV